ncbi:MAG: hypothetical protein JXR65_07190 [Bacteroidales bacterium]|nr:hypothetical protein [Bacteroidales bacterium]
MQIIKSADALTNIAIDLVKRKTNNHSVILIGGYSRTGKTTLSKRLKKRAEEQGINTLIVSIDSWLLSADERKKNSKVYERYDTDGIEDAFMNLLKKLTVTPPVYDPVSRKSMHDIKGLPLNIQSGLIIFEGTIVLSINKLIKRSDLNIFIQTSDCTRLKRLAHFYLNIKGLHKDDYKEIIRSRENEEIPFIKQTEKNAHYILQA